MLQLTPNICIASPIRLTWWQPINFDHRCDAPCHAHVVEAEQTRSDIAHCDVGVGGCGPARRSMFIADIASRRLCSILKLAGRGSGVLLDAGNHMLPSQVQLLQIFGMHAPGARDGSPGRPCTRYTLDRVSRSMKRRLSEAIAVDGAMRDVRPCASCVSDELELHRVFEVEHAQDAPRGTSPEAATRTFVSRRRFMAGQIPRWTTLAE